MPLTAFPQGLSSFGMPLIGTGNLLTLGKVFFVSSTHPLASNDNKGDDPARPMATIDAAVGKCTAGQNDHIIVAAGHVETVSAAGGLTLDVAGITLIGLGNGLNRPQINFTTVVGADMNVDADNILMRNFYFTGGIDALTGPIDVNAAHFTLEDFIWRDVTGECTDVIVTGAAATDMTLRRGFFRSSVNSGPAAGIVLIAATRALIEDIYADGNYSVGFIDCRTTLSNDIRVRNIQVRNRSSVDIILIDTITGSNGMIGPGIYGRVADNAANITEAVQGATFVFFDDIYLVNLAGEKAMLTNITASTDA